jgi:aminopeptidase
MTNTPPCPTIPDTAISVASAHLSDVLTLAFEHQSDRSALVVWDGQCDLAIALMKAYRRSLPDATFIRFDEVEPDVVLAAFAALDASDLVVLIQSTNFRLNEFRIRVHLFKHSLKVIEHPHLARMPDEQALIYIDALAYDAAYYRGVGAALKAHIDSAQVGILDSGGEQLVFAAGFEPAKLNVGDYREMRNVGGQFPIGEVFTESKDLEALAGRVRIGSFGDTSFHVNRPPYPITLIVESGRIVGTEDSTPEFDSVLASIRSDEGEVWIRELGLGMNRAFSQERLVSDIGTYERMCGVHLSMGAKHLTYKKPNIRKRGARHHVDIFALTNSLTMDGKELYRDGAWQVGT